jgi:ParB-like chromosome segregation protein Spo0J
MISNPKSWRDVLPIHPAAELFPLMTADELKALGEDIRKNGLQQAIIILSQRNGEELLLDGRNRLDAMERAGIKFNLKRRKNGRLNLDILGEGEDVPFSLFDLAYTIHEGDVDHSDVDHSGVDPYAYVISANIHRRHLTADQKRDLIAKLVKASPKKSDRQIAETIKASPSTVGKVRKELEQTGDVSKLDRRTDSKGRQQAAHKQPTHKPKPDHKTVAAVHAEKQNPWEYEAGTANACYTAGDCAHQIYKVEEIARKRKTPRYHAWVLTEVGPVAL